MPVALDPRAIALAGVLAAGACTAKSPSVPDPGNGGDAGLSFADVVVAFGDPAEPELCGALATCDEELPDCGPIEVLGPPDDEVYTVAGVIDVGFHCRPIVERPGSFAEIRVWGELAGIQEVSVSDDGTSYEELDVVTGSGAGYRDFDLVNIELPYVRFVRILGSGTLDAVEALSGASAVPVDAGMAFDAGP